MPYAIRVKECEQCKKQYETSPSNPVSRFCSDRCRGNAKMGSAHPRYKGGRTVNKATGYVTISVNGHTKMEHRYVMEQHLGRQLQRNEHVHHKDGNRQNNSIENLELISPAEHSRIHIPFFRSDTHKECPKCRLIKPLADFHIRPERAGGVQSRCKSCMAEHDRNRPDRQKLGKITILSDEQVATIRQKLLEGVTGVHLARQFKVSSRLISRIKHGKARTSPRYSSRKKTL